jgi:hypothetical protein
MKTKFHIVRIYQNRASKRMFETKEKEIKRKWRKCIMMRFIIFTLRQILSGLSNYGE